MGGKWGGHETDRTPGPPPVQKILNQEFPANARQLKDQPNPIKVTVRIVWEHDGEEWIEGTAIRWDRTHVLVSFGDRRNPTIGAWVRPADVRRR